MPDQSSDNPPSPQIAFMGRFRVFLWLIGAYSIARSFTFKY